MLPSQTTHSPQPLIIGVPGVPAWLSDCGSGTDFTLTLTRVGSLHVTSVHRTLTGTHTCHSPKHPSLVGSALVFSWAAASPGNRGQSSCCSQWRTNWGRRKWWGALEGRGNTLRSRAQESLPWIPRVWTAGWDAHRRLHADSSSALSITDCEGPTTCSPVPWSTDLPHTDLPARLRHLLTDRTGAPGRDWSVILRKLSFPHLSGRKSWSRES